MLATASALVVGAVAFVCAGLVLGTLYGPALLRAYVPTLADDLGILVEPEPVVEQLDDGYDGELARRVAAVSAELERSAYYVPSLDEATAGALQGLLKSSDSYARYLSPADYAASGQVGKTGAAGQKQGSATAGGDDAPAARLEGTVGILTLERLEPGAADELARAIKDLAARGATSYVLDLRSNPGGSMNEAVAVASLFLRGGTVAEVIDPSGASERLPADADAQATEAPLAVLVSPDTGGSAEALVGALQDHERAIVVGRPTAGRGTVQSVKTLSFGGAVAYAASEFLTPDGHTVEGAGIEPDVAVRVSSAAADEATVQDASGQQTQEQASATATAIASQSSGTAAASSVATDDDPVLDCALKALAAWVASGSFDDALAAGRQAAALAGTSSSNQVQASDPVVAAAGEDDDAAQPDADSAA